MYCFIAVCKSSITWYLISKWRPISWRCYYEGSTFSSVILSPLMLVRPGFEPATSRMLRLCTLCEKIYVDETGGRFADRFREQLRDLEKKRHRCVQNHLRAILFFLITPTTWLFAGYPYTTGTQKAARVSLVSYKNSSFNWVHSLHTGSMNAFHSTNWFTNSCHPPMAKLLYNFT